MRLFKKNIKSVHLAGEVTVSGWNGPLFSRNILVILSGCSSSSTYKTEIIITHYSVVDKKYKTIWFYISHITVRNQGRPGICLNTILRQFCCAGQVPVMGDNHRSPVNNVTCSATVLEIYRTAVPRRMRKKSVNWSRRGISMKSLLPPRQYREIKNPGTERSYRTYRERTP